ncbi:hypothetical protein D8B26_000817 [Coccidioides posadasii str. Silveira]|uniref:uncharacterized protein n=1 Tax=Coccidioides posadasii (strain RMSCC 757 / Silveira) TaxID=443226 RepID=UPI001BEDC091|nr:hypothetical protein D8B26_000817 [Coccidioides posadasii str. Silveira]
MLFGELKPLMKSRDLMHLCQSLKTYAFEIFLFSCYHASKHPFFLASGFISMPHSVSSPFPGRTSLSLHENQKEGYSREGNRYLPNKFQRIQENTGDLAAQRLREPRYE